MRFHRRTGGFGLMLTNCRDQSMMLIGGFAEVVDLPMREKPQVLQELRALLITLRFSDLRRPGQACS